MTFDKAQGRFTTVQRLSTAQAPGTSHGAYGSGETFATTLGVESQLVMHHGGAGNTDGIDVMIKQPSTGEIQLKARSGSG